MRLSNDLTRAQNSVNVELSFDLSVNITVLEKSEIITTILSTNIPLPTGCLSYDSPKTSFLPAMAVLSSAMSSAPAASSRSSVVALHSSVAVSRSSGAA